MGSDDVLTINVFLVEELSGEYAVSDRGEIATPHIGSKRITGLTADEIEMALDSAYNEEYLRDPQITVFVSKYQSQQVTILGEVNVPGAYPLKGNTALMEALALARGTNRVASLESVILFREESGKVYAQYIGRRTRLWRLSAILSWPNIPRIHNNRPRLTQQRN